MSLAKLVMAYGKPKDLAKRTQPNKVVRDKAFKIASDPKYDVYQRELASMFSKFFNKTSSESGNEKFIHHLETIFGALI